MSKYDDFLCLDSKQILSIEEITRLLKKAGKLKKQQPPKKEPKDNDQ